MCWIVNVTDNLLFCIDFFICLIIMCPLPNEDIYNWLSSERWLDTVLVLRYSTRRGVISSVRTFTYLYRDRWYETETKTLRITVLGPRHCVETYRRWVSDNLRLCNARLNEPRVMWCVRCCSQLSEEPGHAQRCHNWRCNYRQLVVRQRQRRPGQWQVRITFSGYVCFSRAVWS